MLGRTHFLFGLLLGLLLFKYFDLNVYLFVIILTLTSLLPDIDNPNSKAGKKFKIISNALNFIFGHRTLTHSLFFMGLIALTIWDFFNDYWIPFAIGYFSHLLLDCATKQGIDFTWPFGLFTVRGVIKTGGLAEKIFFGCLIVGVGYIGIDLLV